MTEYRASLATMQVGSGCLFRDRDGRVLLVKPTYKERWDLPGGAVERGESPLAACRREVLEELGLDITPTRLAAIDYREPVEGVRGDALRFVFDGGVLDADDQSIRLDPDELSEFRFVGVDDLDAYVIPAMAQRLRSILTAADGAGTLYLENGCVPVHLAPLLDEMLAETGGRLTPAEQSAADRALGR